MLYPLSDRQENQQDMAHRPIGEMAICLPTNKEKTNAIFSKSDQMIHEYTCLLKVPYARKRDLLVDPSVANIEPQE